MKKPPPKKRYITFEQVKPHMLKWAKILARGKCDYWDLINSAWADGKVRFLTQDKIQFASKRIKQDMIDHIRKETKYRQKIYNRERGNRYPKIFNFTTLLGSNEEQRPFAELIASKPTENLGQKELVRFILNHAGLSRMEKLMMNLVFIGGYNLREAGKVCGLSESRISLMKDNVIERLKAIDYTRVI